MARHGAGSRPARLEPAKEGYPSEELETNLAESGLLGSRRKIGRTVRNLLAYTAAIDQRDATAAAAYLERSLELATSPQPTQRDFIAREASYFCAWFRGDLPLAEHWLGQVKTPNSQQSICKFEGV